MDPVTAALNLATAACKTVEAFCLMQKAKYEKMTAAQVQQEAQNVLDFWQPMLDAIKAGNDAIKHMREKDTK